MFKKVALGARIVVVDNENELMLTKTEWDKAQKRYRNELAKKIAREQIA